MFNQTPLKLFFLFYFLIFTPFFSYSEPGKIGPGLARLVSSLSPNDPMAIRFQKMLQEIQATQPGEKMVSAIDLGEAEIARFIPYPKSENQYTPGESPYRERPHLAIFQYNPQKLRIIDFLEEEQHWEQIKKGLHQRDWSAHPLVKRFPDRGHILVLEDLAKRALLETYSKEMSWDLREELKGELKLVEEGSYGAIKGSHLARELFSSQYCSTLLPRLSP